jgi:hypothetical protein
MGRSAAIDRRRRDGRRSLEVDRAHIAGGSHAVAGVPIRNSRHDFPATHRILKKSQLSARQQLASPRARWHAAS